MQKAYLGVCLLLLAVSVALLVKAVQLGLSIWPRVLMVGLWLGLSLQACQVLGNGGGEP